MRETLKAMSDSFIANKMTFTNDCGFQIISRHTATACAFLYMANKRTADGECIKECAETVRNNAPKMSYFKLEPNNKFAPAFLSLSSAPDRLLEGAAASYEKFKEIRGGSNYLTFAALLLESVKKSDEELAKRIERGEVIFDCLKQRHKILTDSRDAVFSLLLASSSKSVEDIMSEVESTYKEIKPLGENNAMQICSLILARSDKPQQDKIACFSSLYEKLKDTKPRYGNGWEMLFLAVLSLLTDDTESAANDILDVFNELEDKEGYKGLFAKFDKHSRLLHAAMIVIADALTEEVYDLAVAAVAIYCIIRYDRESSSDTVPV